MEPSAIFRKLSVKSMSDQFLFVQYSLERSKALRKATFLYCVVICNLGNQYAFFLTLMLLVAKLAKTK